MITRRRHMTISSLLMTGPSLARTEARVVGMGGGALRGWVCAAPGGDHGAEGPPSEGAARLDRELIEAAEPADLSCGAILAGILQTAWHEWAERALHAVEHQTVGIVPSAARERLRRRVVGATHQGAGRVTVGAPGSEVPAVLAAAAVGDLMAS